LCISALFLAVSCGLGPDCGPSGAVVETVIDGDTVVLSTGERVRYLLVDTPEPKTGACFAAESTALNVELTEGRKVSLGYDVECADRYGRLLAYVTVHDTREEVNERMVESGHACVLSIPPNGADHLEHFKALEDAAKAERRGMWGACQADPCAR
jgi:micrococcal nuclease